MNSVCDRSVYKRVSTLTIVIACISGCAQTPIQASSSPAPAVQMAVRDGTESPIPPDAIRITAVRLSAAGYMIDMRYKVVDVEKAAPLLQRKVQPYLLEQSTGARLLVPDTPKLGTLRQKVINPKPDKDYYMFFANPGRFIKSGDKVTLVMGDIQVSNLSVE